MVAIYWELYALNMLWVHTKYVLVDLFAYKRMKTSMIWEQTMEQQISMDNDFFSVSYSVIHCPVFMLSLQKIYKFIEETLKEFNF